MDTKNADVFDEDIQRSAEILHAGTGAVKQETDSTINRCPALHFLNSGERIKGRSLLGFHSPEEDELLLIPVLSKESHQCVKLVFCPTDLPKRRGETRHWDRGNSIHTTFDSDIIFPLHVV